MGWGYDRDEWILFALVGGGGLLVIAGIIASFFTVTATALLLICGTVLYFAGIAYIFLGGPS